MSKYANINTGATADNLPRVIETAAGTTHHPTFDQCALLGWREIVETEAVLKGWRVKQYTPMAIDWRTCRMVVTEQENIAAAELAANGDRWTLENHYITACDQLRTALGMAATKTKLGFAELEPMMQTLKAGNESAYNQLRDWMQTLNAALIRYDVKWWDAAVWHPEVES